MSTIWPLTISRVVHQGTKAGDCLSKVYRNLVIFLDDILIMADSPEQAAEHTEVVISRLRDKEKGVNLETNPDYPVSRCHCKLHKDAPSTVRRKTAKLKSSALSLLENVPKAREIF